jgi:hypothetical protein
LHFEGWIARHRDQISGHSWFNGTELLFEP